MQTITIRDRAYDLELTVQAFAEISDMCPGKDIGRISEVLQAPIAQVMVWMAKALAAMSRGAEAQKAFEDPHYEARPMLAEEITTLPVLEGAKLIPTFNEILTAAMGGRQVEVKPSKKKGETST